MIYAWLVAFLVGCILGELVSLYSFWQTPWFSSWTYLSVIFLCVLCIRRSIWRPGMKIVIIGMGFYWGAVHNPQYVTEPGKYRVTNARLWCRLQPLLVEDSHGFYRAYGRGNISDWGKVTISPKAQALLQEGIWFESENDTQFIWLELKIRKHLQGLGEGQSLVAKKWFEALFLGESSSLDFELIRSFKVLGLFHLLVISGAHIALFAKIASLGILLPLQVIYALRWIRPHRWVQTFPVLQILALVIILAFSIATGMSAATQRSLLIYVVLSFTNIYSFGLATSKRICVAAVFQALLFPIGFVSSANLMSWMAYLFVFQEYAGSRFRQVSIWPNLWRLFLLQCKLAIFAAMAFGNLSLIGVVCNLFVVPFFGIFYVALLMVVFLFFWIPKLLELSLHLLEWIEWAAIDLAAYFRDLPFAYWELADFHWIWRWLSCLVSALLLCQLLSRFENRPHLAN